MDTLFAGNFEYESEEKLQEFMNTMTHQEALDVVGTALNLSQFSLAESALIFHALQTLRKHV